MPEYLLVFGASAMINYLTLYVVGRKTKTGITNLHTSKAFLLGDFFLIPLYFVALARFWERSVSILVVMEPLIIFAIAVLAGVITFSFGIKFRLLKSIWIPHGMFHWTIVFSFLLTTYTVFMRIRTSWAEWIILLTLLALHQFGASKLGTKYLPVK